MTDIKSYVIHPTKKNRTLDIIDFDDHIYSSGRRGCEVPHIEKYSDELKTCFSNNGVGFNPVQSVVCLKEKLPEGFGDTNLPSDKHIKNNYSSFKLSFKEAYEYI